MQRLREAEKILWVHANETPVWALDIRDEKECDGNNKRQNQTTVPDGYPLRFLTIVVGFRTQASPVMFISDCRSTMPMEPQVNIA